MVVNKTNILDETQTAAFNLLDAATQIKISEDGTTPLETDTTIGVVVGTSTISEVDTSVLGEHTYIASFGIGDAVGNTIRKAQLFDGDNSKSLDISLTPEFTKGSDQILQVEMTVKATAKNV